MLRTFAALCALGLAALGWGTVHAQPSRVWIAPMPFVKARELRTDYFHTLTTPAAWPSVLGRTNVLKSYIMVLPQVPVPGKASPELSDAQLGLLAKFAKDHSLSTAFEVGGLRTSARVRGAQAGERYARSELRHLKRWLRVGGRIDYLTTDHAVMMNMRGVGFPGPGLDPNRPCKMTVQELTEELADYFTAVHREIPSAKFGVIESLGFFHVKGSDGKQYRHTDPLLPVWHFHEFFDGLLAAMERRSLVLDHFHIDFGFRGVRHDGRREKRLNFARVLGVESYVQSKGVRAGVIINAFHLRGTKDPAQASREAHERTLRFFREYVAAGGNADHFVIQTWHPYPDQTGPETQPHTVLNIARDVLQCEAFPK